MTDDFLPLDAYPQISFPKCDDSERHTLWPQSVTQNQVTHFTAPQSVTVATVTPYISRFDQRFCLMCGAKLPIGTYRSKKTCSTNCRKALSRRAEMIQREVNQVKDALATLERYSDRWSDLHWQIMQAIGACGIEAGSVSRRVAPKGDNR